MDFDKYGRLLVNVYPPSPSTPAPAPVPAPAQAVSENDKKNISQMLIEKGYAYEYFGGSKHKWN